MDIELFYEEMGSGEPLILLHGNGEDHTIFDNVAKHFAKQYHVIAIDTRGHGKSPLGDEPFSLYQFAEDLNDFMDEHNIEKANILGFSDGGNIALIFASKYPEKVIKLIANGANTKPSGIKPLVHLAMLFRYMLYSVAAAFSGKFELKKALYYIMLHEPHITKEELEQITAPTLVLVGTEDLIKESESKYIKNSIPNSEIVFVLGNHFIVKNNTKDYIFAVEKFLDK